MGFSKKTHVPDPVNIKNHKKYTQYHKVDSNGNIYDIYMGDHGVSVIGFIGKSLIGNIIESGLYYIKYYNVDVNPDQTAFFDNSLCLDPNFY
jgi:hypothetical protein